MHVLHPADQRRRDSGQSGTTYPGRRCRRAGVRPVVSGESDGVWRPQRSRQRGVAAGSFPTRQQTPGGARHSTQGDLSRATVVGMSQSPERQLIDDLLRPLERTTWRFYVLVAGLGGVVLLGLVAWVSQMAAGFGVTGIAPPILWAFYITNFVFWIGI